MIDHHQPAADTLAEIEDVAVDLATLAGAEIERTLGAFSSVRYKTGAGGQVSLRDPVSEVDGRIEQLIRARLAERFPDHDIIGEEMKDRLGREHEYLWAVDPIDGTTNFVNGFPIFAASIGVLRDGYPVAGAVWCSISHALRTGVYHARAGGSLRFERDQVVPKLNPAVQRRLAGVPSARISEAGAWDTRKTGSAAVECALVAAGLLEVARFAAPNIWDVAGGIALLHASGCAVHRAVDGAWAEMQRFEPMPGPDGQTDLRHWRNELVVGEPAAVSRMGRQARKRDTP